ncbi:MAG: outer membrane lipoprotein carrier protein LolA [Rhodospirillales bacterium]|nr:MAG: outer membrane lipoprotein carrier protein LolA [Rhodospirillales bacterium]
MIHRWLTIPALARVGSAVLIALALAAVPLARDSDASRPQAAEIGSEARRDLARIERYLNAMTTVRARFLQVASNGQFAEGNIYIARPGNMRVEYDPPTPVLIVADGTWLIYYDQELEQVSYIPLRSTPVSILTRQDVSLTDGDLLVTDFTRDGGSLRLTVVQKDDPWSGSVTLVFDENPMTLRKWTVVDAQGVEIQVSLVTARFDIPLDRDLFQFKDPRVFKDRL